LRDEMLARSRSRAENDGPLSPTLWVDARDSGHSGGVARIGMPRGAGGGLR
jgi:hypothetical protein